MWYNFKMPEEMTLENLAEKIDGKIDQLALAVAKGFNENTKQHQQIFDRLDGIDKKLEGIVYRKEFEQLEKRIKIIEEALAIKQ